MSTRHITPSFWLFIALAVLSVPAVVMVIHRLYWLTSDVLNPSVALRVNEAVVMRDELQAQIDLARHLATLQKEFPLPAGTPIVSDNPGTVVWSLIMQCFCRKKGAL